MASHPKKGQKTRSVIGFLDESGVSERPTVRRTWSPKGITPIIRSTGNWQTFSVIGVLACTPKGQKPKLYLRIFKHSIHDTEVICFLKELRRHIKRKMILVWDGLMAHRSKQTIDFLKTQKTWLTMERFPAYAPELNPVEYVWSNGKRKELANFCPNDTWIFKKQIRKCVRRLQRNPEILNGFLRASTLYK